jgi:membrane associated rhomboid family serine protease
LINQSVDLFSSRIYTLVTTSFFHADLGHLAANMLGLWVFGRVVERRIGRLKMLGVYFGATIIAVATSSLVHLLIFQENIAGLGASGGLMGLVATAILLEPFYLTYDFGIPIPIMVYGWIAIAADVVGIIHPLDEGIGHFAHLGGFVSVAVLGYFLSNEEQHKLRTGLFINLISLALAVAIYFLLR